MQWENIAIVCGLVFLSGIFSGLNLGFMSLQPLKLKRMITLGNKNAKKIFALRKKGTLLLCTLLLGNVAVNASLSIFLGELISGLIAIVVATSLIVLFGEILPQSFFSRFSLKIGSKLTWLIWIFIVVLYPLAKPLSLIIDKLFGKERPMVLSKREIQELIKQQVGPRKSGLDKTEYKILERGLFFSHLKVKEVMTPLDKIYTLHRRRTLNEETLREILKAGYSRIPVMNKKKDQVVGMIYVRRLATVNPDRKLAVSRMMEKNVYYIGSGCDLEKALTTMRRKKTHLLVVQGYQKRVVGIITMEDVITEIVGEMKEKEGKLIRA